MNKFIQLANVLNGLAPDSESGFTDDSIDVRTLVEVCTEEQAGVALLCSGMMPQTCEEIAAGAGVDPETIRHILEEDAEIGLLISFEHNNIKRYLRPPLIPGVIENLLLSKRTRSKLVAQYFEEYNLRIDTKNTPNFAMGRGFLRTIPVKESIEVDTRIASYEEVKTYIEAAKSFSVADCACRTGARLLGKGCEHTHVDTCIQLGDGADYLVRTGRARRVTKEEALDILKDMERNGLVHQIWNQLGANKSTFICNCCGCSCTSLKALNLMNLPDANRSNYVAKIDPEKCVGCGACVEDCNVNALALGSCFAKESQVPTDHPHPFETDWTEEFWNPNFTVRKMVNDFGTAPCKTFCPAHISVQGYIKKAKEGKFDEALKIIKRENPFPAVCGRICPHGCEDECTRAELDEAIAIDDIKKFVADKELKSEFRYVPKVYDHYSQRIAVIGAGPAGLSCAYYAASFGFRVTVFEKQDILGGMLTLGIPSFRLENDVINAEIDVLRQLGVEFRTGVEVGKDITLAKLRENGFNAFFVAIGAQNGRKLGIEGEDAAGVTSGIDFLREVNLGKAGQLSGKTVIIGGGNVAIDVARTALRIGSAETMMFCLEKKEEMPSLPEEQEEAMGEGVVIENSWGPKRILVRDGKVTGVEFKRCVSVFDAQGRFAPAYDESQLLTVECDNVLLSVGQSIDWGGLIAGSKANVTLGSTLEVDGMTLQSAEPDVFAGGDVITGPKFAIDAIASGKTGAISLKRFLLGQDLTIRREREYRPLDKKNIDLAGYDRRPRQRVPQIDHKNSSRTFRDLRNDLTDEQIHEEANRCLGCGITVLDEYKCIGCGICFTRCEFDAIKLVRKYDIAPSATAKEFMEDFTEYSAQRQKRIAEKKQAVQES